MYECARVCVVCVFVCECVHACLFVRNKVKVKDNGEGNS